MKLAKLSAVMLAVALVSAVAYTSTRAADAPSAEAKTFDFKDPKKVNGIVFVLDSKLEPIVGIGSGMTGSISYDPAKPEAFTGSITIPAEGLDTTNERMTQVMQGENWLNITQNKDFTMTFDKVTKVEDQEDGSKLLTIDGKLQAMGLSLPKTLQIGVTHLPDGAKARGGAESGDLLVLRSKFSVTRQDLGIQIDRGPDVVANRIDITVAVAGYEK